MLFTNLSAQTVVKGWIVAIKGWIYEFFHPNLEGYTNFDFGSGELVNIQVIIFGIFGGVLLASLYTIYVKNVIGAFVRKLLSEKCLSEQAAKTLPELGFMNNPFVRHALKGSLLASTVIHVPPLQDATHESQTEPSAEQGTVPTQTEPQSLDAQQTAGDGQQATDNAQQSTETVPPVPPTSRRAAECAKPDPATVRYYIKEEKKYVAEMRFNARGSGWPTFFFVVLISIICIFLIFAFLPQIIRFLDNTISIFSVAGNTIK